MRTRFKRLLWPLAGILVSMMLFIGVGYAEQDIVLGVLLLSFLVLFPCSGFLLLGALWELCKGLWCVYVKKQELPEVEVFDPIRWVRDHSTEARHKREERVEMLSHMNDTQRRRYVLLRLAGYLMYFFTFYFMYRAFVDHENWAIPGTLTWIAALVLPMYGNPLVYNESVPSVYMILMPEPLPIQNLYEAFAAFRTPLGSPYLANIRTMGKRTVMIFGPDAAGRYVIVYQNKSGDTLYCTQNMIPALIRERLTACCCPAEGEALEDDRYEAVCQQLFRILEVYAQRGILPRQPNYWGEMPQARL